MFILPSRAWPAEGALHSTWEPQIVSTKTAGAPRDAHRASPGCLVKMWGPSSGKERALKSQKELKQLHMQEAEAPTTSAQRWPTGLQEAGPLCKTFNQNK